MKTFIFIGGILFGSVLGMMSMSRYVSEANQYRYLKCADDEEAICVPHGTPVSNSARLRLDKGVEATEKEIFRKEIQLRIYANDGTYIFGSENDFISTDVGDVISGNWIKDKK